MVTPRMSLGIDLVEVARVARIVGRHPARFASKYFTDAEQDECGCDAMRLASRWAAKEAAAKALGTGFGPVRLADFEVLCDERGGPRLHLHGAALLIAAAAGLEVWSVSLSHTSHHAVAVVAGLGADARSVM